MGLRVGGGDNAPPVEVRAQEKGKMWGEFEKLSLSRLSLRCQWDHLGPISSRELDIYVDSGYLLLLTNYYQTLGLNTTTKLFAYNSAIWAWWRTAPQLGLGWRSHF